MQNNILELQLQIDELMTSDLALAQLGQEELTRRVLELQKRINDLKKTGTVSRGVKG